MKLVRLLLLLACSALSLALVSCSDNGGGCDFPEECVERCEEICVDTSVESIACSGGACVCRCAATE